MKRFLIILALLVAVWIVLKASGLIGRQMRSDINVTRTVPLVEMENSAIVAIEPTKYGIYSYGARLDFDGASNPGSGKTFAATIRLTETYCASGKVIHQWYHEIRANEKKFSVLGLRHPALIKPPIHRRWEKICLELKLDQIHDGDVNNVGFSLIVNNARPCWGIECLLD